VRKAAWSVGVERWGTAAAMPRDLSPVNSPLPHASTPGAALRSWSAVFKALLLAAGGG
jgi:hypothetical protein